MTKSILHIVSDYPDGKARNNTKAVKNLIDESKNVTHIIFAYRRERKVSFSKKESIYCMDLFFLPFGVLHTSLSFFWALFIFKKLKAYNVKFDVIHGHKLSTDGVLAYFLSKMTGKPYFISVRGDTDFRFISNKKLSKWLFRRVLREAKQVFYVSAWAKNKLETLLELKPNTGVNLPNIVHAKPEWNFNTKSKKIIFVGRMESAKEKGLFSTIRALRDLQGVHLEIVGKRCDKTLREIELLSKSLDVQDRVKVVDKMNQKELIKYYKEFSILVMPSQRETFGMVYVEALLNNLPVICCSDSGIDGYLNDKPYIGTVEYGNTAMLAKKIEVMMDCQKEIKNILSDDLRNGQLGVFSTTEIKKTYMDNIIHV